MTMAGLEVEHVDDPAAKLAAFSVARIVEAVQHPNADRLRVCQVDTKDGRKEIVCGAPNARAGPDHHLCADRDLYPWQLASPWSRGPCAAWSPTACCARPPNCRRPRSSDGILELADSLAVGAGAAEALGLEAVIDFEVTPNRPDWLGVAGIARDLAAAGLGTLKDLSVAPVKGGFPCPIDIRLDGSDACPAFAGRLIRGVKNGPSPAWLQARLNAIGLRPISALVDVTNLITYDRARPLHVYDAAKLTGGFVEARLGREGEKVAALDGAHLRRHPGDLRHRRRLRAPSAWAASWAARPPAARRRPPTSSSRAPGSIPIRTAQTGRDHRHHLRRPVPLRPRRRSRLRGPRAWSWPPS